MSSLEKVKTHTLKKVLKFQSRSGKFNLHMIVKETVLIIHLNFKRKGTLSKKKGDKPSEHVSWELPATFDS